MAAKIAASDKGTFARICLSFWIIILASSLGYTRENWVEVRSAHFLVVSNAGEEKARKTATQFEHVRAFFRQSLAVAGTRPSPTITILAAKNAATMGEIFPEAFQSDRQAHPVGVYFRMMGQPFAVVQLDVQRSGYFVPLYHEYYHSLTGPDFPDLPLWLSEGLADFYGRTVITDTYVGTGEPDRDYLDLLRQTPLISLGVLFRVDHSSPYYNEGKKAGMFYAESWALTHYLMIGSPEARQRLVAYLQALGRGGSTDQAIAALGDLATLQRNLEKYINQRKFLFVNAPLPRIESEELKVRNLSEAEADAYLGGFSTASNHRKEAEEFLNKALRRDPNSPLAHQYLAIAQYSSGQRDKAMESISQAIKLDPNIAMTRYLRAYIAISGTNLPPNDAPVEEDLRSAITLEPDSPASYSLLGLFLALCTPNAKEGLSLATKATLMDSSDSRSRLNLAKVLAQMNRFDEARASASRASALARSPEEKAAVEDFVSQLRQIQNERSGQDRSHN